MKRDSPLHPPGRETSLKESVLNKGADWLQKTAPLSNFDVYVVGFHCAKHEPSMQMEAHHFCQLVNREFLQCVIFDGNTENANLIGIEYIISERLFEQQPPEEKEYWHPHNYEIFSGQLVAPGLPTAAEKELLRLLVNSYGKTWHTWHTGRHDREGEGSRLPNGDVTLMWSFNRDGESDPQMRQHRNVTMQIDSQQNRRERQDLVNEAHPQWGVDVLKDAFPEAEEEPPPGVQDIQASSTKEESV